MENCPDRTTNLANKLAKTWSQKAGTISNGTFVRPLYHKTEEEKHAFMLLWKTQTSTREEFGSSRSKMPRFVSEIWPFEVEISVRPDWLVTDLQGAKQQCPILSQNLSSGPGQCRRVRTNMMLRSVTYTAIEDSMLLVDPCTRVNEQCWESIRTLAMSCSQAVSLPNPICSRYKNPRGSLCCFTGAKACTQPAPLSPQLW